MYYVSDKMETLKQQRERQRQAIERRLAAASKSKTKPKKSIVDEELTKHRKDASYLGGSI